MEAAVKEKFELQKEQAKKELDAADTSKHPHRMITLIAAAADDNAIGKGSKPTMALA